MRMKKHFLILLVLSIFLLFGTSCAVYVPQEHHPRNQVIYTRPSGKVPPGQMKKMTGAKSAKAYAPGQQKKHKNK